jgi:sugar phosphate isomerase/epimerase
MRIGINEWTTFPASFEDELAAYRAAGAGAIGILEFKLEGVDDVRGKLRESGLAASACLPAAGSILPSPLIPGPGEPEARVESICASVARFAELEASCVFFLTGPGDDRQTVVEGIGRVAEAGARHGVRVALEPIHPSQANVLSPIATVDAALDLIGDADVGILFDTWHLDGVSHADRIYGVHVADRREPTRSDFDRDLPGAGSRVAVRSLVEAGYDGWFDVEVMSDDGTFGEAFPDALWALPAEEIARRAVEAVNGL